jgi:hypothetical protein
MSQSAEDWVDQLAILTRMLGAGDLTAGRPGSLWAVGVPSAADATAACGRLCVFPSAVQARRYRGPCPG